MFFPKKMIHAWHIFIMLFLLLPIQSAYGISSSKNPLNILLVTIDTLRADHLGCYGYNAVKTPSIDKLAKNGTLFTNAYSPIPLTLPSHVTMMTGQYPIHHGVQNNGNFILQDSANTLAEILNESGYKTGAVVASYVLASHFGLNQGFDDYDDYFFQKQEKMASYNENSRIGEDVTNRATKWIQANYKKPFFFWVHYFDPHALYEPPAPFDVLYKDKPYDGEIAYTDQCLGKLIETMEKLSLLENTCIILVGDHGEGLWEHNEQAHGLFIYNTTLMVPLIISCPKLFKTGEKIISLVRTTDIMPTTLELLGIKPEKLLIQGISLIPFLTQKKKDIHLEVYCESLYPKLNLNWAPLEGIVTSEGWKYIHAPKPELYNLKEDPEEKNNLIARNPQKAKLLNERMHALKKGLLSESPSPGDAKQVVLSHEMRQRMQSLGYIGYSGSKNKESEEQNDMALPDPKDKVHLLNQIEMARELLKNGKVDQSNQKYEEVLKEDPENKMALFDAGLTYSNTGQLEKALNLFLRHEKLEPENYDCKNNLGLLYDNLGMPDKAIKSYKEAIRINSKVPYLHHNLAKVYLKTNALDSAIQEFQQMQSVSNDPMVMSIAIGNLGGIDARQGNFEEAVKKFQESIRLDKNNRDAHISLADAYFSLGRNDQSIDEWKVITDLWPDDCIAYFKLAQLYLDDYKPEQATKNLKICLRLCPDHRDARGLLERIYRGQ